MYFDSYLLVSCGITPYNEKGMEYVFYPNGRFKWVLTDGSGISMTGNWDESGTYSDSGNRGDDIVFDNIADDWSSISAHGGVVCLSGIASTYELVRVYK